MGVNSAKEKTMSFSRLLVMVALLVSVQGVSAQELPDFNGFQIVTKGGESNLDRGE